MIELSKKLKLLVKKNWEVSDIQLFGVKIGDSYEAIDRSKVTDANRIDLDHEDAIKETELPLEDKLNGVIKHGGSIRIGKSDGFKDYVYGIESGVVVQFSVQMENLKPLGIKKESHIEKMLGCPNQKKEYVRHGKPAETEYYYEKNKFLLVWSNPFNKLLNIIIGERAHNERNT